MKCGWGIRDRLCQRISSALTKIVHASLYEYCGIWDRFTAPQSRYTFKPQLHSLLAKETGTNHIYTSARPWFPLKESSYCWGEELWCIFPHSRLDNEGSGLRKVPQTYPHCELDVQGNKGLINKSNWILFCMWVTLAWPRPLITWKNGIE